MNIAPDSYSSTRKRLMAAVASLAVIGAVGAGALATGTAPVLADAVRVEAPQVPSFADVVERVSPAVVSVKVKAKIQPTADDGSDDQNGFDNLPDNPQLRRFFREFRGFGDQGGQFGMPRFNHRNHGNGEPRPVAQGSGFFISEDGYLVTNNHVVSEGSDFTVVTNDGKELDAKLIGTDPRTDLAVLKVDGGGKFTYVDFADDSKIRIGDWVVAVGNPFGLGGTVTAGIVSARGRDIGAGPYDDFIQIDASVNRGNSGGPTFNLNGQVIGINTAIFSPSGGSVGIAFDIPASTAKQVVEDLMKNGSVQRGWLGVEIQPVTSDIAESLGLKSDKGALVSSAQDAGPGKKAGIVAGDVITQVDGKDVASPKELARMIGAYAPGKSVDVTVWRNGKNETVKVDLGTLPSSDKQASNEDGNKQAAPAKADTLADLGLTVTKSENGKGLVVTDVDPDSDAADRGIQPGDVITSINSNEVNTTDDVSKAMTDASKSGRKAVLMQITRDDSNRFVALPVGKG
ncbi:Do family serine endopeptidase [Mesorhizobium sp. M1A.F.Ca.IN.022.07.1.1]|uniref:Do family serine endopeptidase n=1 Tax=unclassified Mesorhizobium TaxID=325217 RepID=UPI0007FD275F|nr:MULTISPECIES: Do family serine endopeptidase [unclassified Mesorhizobium]TGV91668.1 Do family serine endopeptidase [Mesorhizobium sp. M00.F.Ca.ET.158.01.1.1]AZO58899.1 Do family serine endopeptidase [Mesorhizobium sp. M1A.F.Ca.IN.022.06.1.1]MCT2579035.1 Do family serine endopeptidase [Mesorhizobium sp. P13.3]MDF3167975.1 Do family serine endopeptidase [Mesorhizobium sp. P16.1]MDF3178140.1 Do family serine endopeptidase [Mesorhizobium sp. P17.1]